MCNKCQKDKERLITIYITIKEAKNIYNSSQYLKLEPCIAEEIAYLISMGVATLESCCGHNLRKPWCLIAKRSHDLVIDLGYLPIKESNEVYYIELKGSVQSDN